MLSKLTEAGNSSVPQVPDLQKHEAITCTAPPSASTPTKTNSAKWNV